MDSGGEEFEVRYVLDNRPLINFVLTGHGDLLQCICDNRTCTTSSVRAQFEKSAKHLCSALSRSRRSDCDCTQAMLAACGSWSQHFDPGAIEVVSIPATQANLTLTLERKYPDAIDPGESDVLALCLQRSWIAVLDDLPARQVALELGVSTIGTVELLIRAVDREVLTLLEAEEMLECMRQTPWGRAPTYSLPDARSGIQAIWPE